MKLPGWYPPILAYHRIHPQAGSDTPTLSPKIFDQQMRILSKRWKPISLPEMVSCLEGNRTLPYRAVAVTFDDGTDDNFTYAFPILAEHRIPATVFMIAGNLNRPGSLGAEQILKMRRAGIDFGSHTSHHAYLPSLPITQVREELAGSKESLERMGLSVDLLSYPAGGFSPEIVRAAKAAGYRAACTTNRGIRRFPVDRWTLRRITMHAKFTSPFGIWVRCCGYYGLNRRLRAPS
ncbi:MAG: polysaccharide deacetylase family protein [Candidatus Omnitrophica bacterium]|nr:polysaccharide deacetylase family protein [Candidatus Omnitrophota bacterium]